MFGRRILVAAAFAAAYAQAQSGGLTITNPSPSSWWVAGSQNTLAWSCDTSPYSSFTVVVSNSDKTILSAPLALIATVPNYDCSLTVSPQQSSLAVSTSWTLSLADIQNITNVYASTQFEVKSFGSPYAAASSAASGSSGTATGTAGSASSTGTSSKSSGAAANVVPVGLTMAAALLLGLVVA